MLQVVVYFKIDRNCMKMEYKNTGDIFTEGDKEIYYLSGIEKCRDVKEKTFLKGINTLINNSILITSTISDQFFLHCLQLAIKYISEERMQELTKYKLIELISAAPINFLSEYRAFIEKIFDLLLNHFNTNDYIQQLKIVAIIHEKVYDLEFDPISLELANAVDELYNKLFT